MNLQREATLSDVINAWGTPTPFGVSRSSPGVARAAGQGLLRHVEIDELAARVAERIVAVAGTEAAWFCHCSAAGVTLAAAGALAGSDPVAVAALPRRDEAGVIAIQEEHCVHYGQPIEQALRLSGAHVLRLAGSPDQRRAALDAAARAGTLRAVMAVDSSLVKHQAALTRPMLSTLARRHGVGLIVDAAAQDWRLNDRDALAQADITLFSAQKYLAAPTCGILAGTQRAVDAARAHLGGIGRAMKPSKEALFGLWQALDERDWAGLPALRQRNLARSQRFARAVRADDAAPVRVSVQDTADHGPFPRVLLRYAPPASAAQVAEQLMRGSPRIAVGRGHLDRNALTLELTHVDPGEEAQLLARLQAIHASL